MTKRAALSPAATFDLSAVSAELLAGVDERGHTARTLVHEDDFRVVLMAMKAGSSLPSHRAAETVSIHALAGRVRLKLPETMVDLHAGRLLVLQRNLVHDVEALEESALLLTFGWRVKP